MSLKFKVELCVMTMKNDGKIMEELTVSSKLTWGIWQILTRTLKNLKNFHFNRLLSTKANNVWAKKSIGESCFMALNILCSKHNSSEMASQFYFKFCIILYQMVQICRFFGEPLDLTTVLPISSIKRSSPEVLIL